jgi:glycosyltransferase involved in cell wall biosynthesis
MFFPYVDKIRADYLIYHVYDLYDHAPGWNDNFERDERALIRRADLVIAASEQMAERLHAKVRREVHVLPNGADVAAFDKTLNSCASLPTDLRAIPRPRLGYVGSLHPQVDYGLVADLARRQPDWHFVFVGHAVSHTDPRADAERATCAALANVHFLGGKPVHEVPQYMVNMDVNLMCYRLSEGTWIKAGYPLKLHEYLAAGRPIVSVDMPTVRPFSEVIQLATGVDDWQQAIECAVLTGGRGSPESRRAIAAQNSWDKRVRTLELWLNEMTTKTRTSAEISVLEAPGAGRDRR